MSEMVERVARALFAQRHPHLDWDRDAMGSRKDWFEDARAAIAAMREPTYEMYMTLGGKWENPPFPERWRTMIDEALK